MYVFVCGFFRIRPLDQPYLVFLTELFFPEIQFLSVCKCFFSPEKTDRQKMLYPLVFDGCLD
jgi:hypothetical protein